MRILKDSTIGVVVDMQERLFPVIHDNTTLEKNVQTLIQGLSVLEVPLMVTEQYKKGLGETIDSINSLVDKYFHSEKIAFSCCDEPTFMEHVETSKKRSVLIAGIESHICVLQTAIDLKERGFTPVVIEDCVASRNPENKRIAMKRLHQEGILVSSYESILFELCRFAGNDAFKAISKLVK